MGFRFHRRINLGNGLGLNLSRSGIGTSVRGKYGAIGSSGFSIRTGIPGLTFRQGWGKGGQGALVFLVTAAFLAVIVVVVGLAALLAVVLWQGIGWCVLTAQDYIEYRRTGEQSVPELDRLVSADPVEQLQPEKTLAELLEEASRPRPAKE